jgi:hypothetical protein
MREPCDSSFCTINQHFLPVGAIVVEHTLQPVHPPLDTWKHVELPDELFQSLVPWQIVNLIANGLIQVSYKSEAVATVIIRIYIGTSHSSPKKQPKELRECWELLFQSISRSPRHWDGHLEHKQEPWLFSSVRFFLYSRLNLDLDDVRLGFEVTV